MRVAIYTPVYSSSPGTRYRVDRLAESLAAHGIEVRLVLGQGEGVFQNLYRRLAANLLTNARTWSLLGRLISKQIEPHKPDLAITITDVTAGAARYLTQAGIRAIVSVEDLSLTYHPWLRRDPKAALAVKRILSSELSQAECVITPAYSLRDVIENELGVRAIAVPIGLRMNTTPDLAEARERRWALHARPVRESRQARALTEVAAELKRQGVQTLARKVGSRVRVVEGVQWYSFSSPELAARFGQKAFVGVIVEFRPAYTLSTLYFHASLLQPVLAIGEGPWVREARGLRVPLVRSVEEVTPKMIRSLNDSASKLQVPRVHEPLLELINGSPVRVGSAYN